MIWLTTVDSAWPWRTGRLAGVLVLPVPDAERLRTDLQPLPARCITPTGASLAVTLRFAQVHYSGRLRGLPAWDSECLVEGVASLEPGTDIWCARALLRRPRPLDPEAFWRPDRPDVSERAYQRLLTSRIVQPASTALSERRQAERRCVELLAWLARALSAQGKQLEATARLDEARALARESPPGAVPRVLIERARLSVRAGDHVRARAILEEAWERSLSHQETASAIEASYLMARVSPVAERVSVVAAAVPLANAANDAGSRRWRPVLYATLGDALRLAGQEEAAREALETAATLRRIMRTPWQPE